MKQRILNFSVINQRITSDDTSVVADSRNYLAARFCFDNTWQGVEKTAVFSQGDKVYNMLLEGDMCRIPAEVISEGAFYVSVFGGDLITADKIQIDVTESGLLEGVAPPVPTPDIYNQLVERVAAEAADAAAASELAVLSSQMSQEFANQAETYQESCNSSAGQAMSSEAAAINAMVLAEQASTKATESAIAAQVNAEVAHSSFLDAQAAASEAKNAAIDAQDAVSRAEAAKLFKQICGGTLDATTGGVAQIKAELIEEIYDMVELRLYLEVPVGAPTGASTTMYVNAHIDGNPALQNAFLATTATTSKIVSGSTMHTVAIADIITLPDGNRYVRSVANLLDANYGINARVNPLATQCPWNISKTANKRYLYLNISNYNFESGTKWVLEGR